MIAVRIGEPISLLKQFQQLRSLRVFKNLIMNVFLVERIAGLHD